MIKQITIKDIEKDGNCINYNCFFDKIKYNFQVKYNFDNIQSKPHCEGIAALLFLICVKNNIKLKVCPKIHISLVNSFANIEKCFNNTNFCKNNCIFMNIDHSIIKKINKKILPVTGGVDSTSSLISNINNLDYCIFILGLDIKLSKTDQKWIDICTNNCQKILNICNFKKNKILVCETNIWDLLIYDIQPNLKIDCGVPNFAQGVSVYSMLAPLCDNFDSIIVSGSGIGNYKKFMINYNRSEIEKYFKCDKISLETDDTFCRHEKIDFIYKNRPECMPLLRYCTKWNSLGGLNCQNCEKCLRTILILNLLGLAKTSKTKQLSKLEIKKLYNNSIKAIGEKDRYTYKKQLVDLYENYLKRYKYVKKINFYFYKSDECFFRNGKLSLFLIEKKLLKQLLLDDSFNNCEENLMYSNDNNKSLISNTLNCFDPNLICHKLHFHNLFKNFDFVMEQYSFNSKKNKQILDFNGLEDKIKLNKLNKLNNYNWYCKPIGSHGGLGIIITSKLNTMYNTCGTYILSKEIKPFLYNNRVFSLRVHLIITYTNKMELYIPNEIQCVVSPYEYDEKSNNYKSKLSNVTSNYNDNLKKDTQIMLNTIFDQNKCQIINKKIKYILGQMTTVINNLISKQYKSKYLLEYHIFGLDLMLDENFEMYVLEINLNVDIYDFLGGYKCTNIQTNNYRDKIIIDIKNIIKNTLTDNNIKLKLFEKLY